MSRRGTVYITGAGPGAPDLLTLRAVRVLERAEVVLYDSLVSPDVLQFCPAGCEILPVGKRCGTPAPSRQERIHRLLDEASRRCRTVVRLKGGDPCVFGRGGEELAFLTGRGIPWEVIPGISAGIGGLSALGLPLTHRDVASSVTLLTGSRAISGDLADLPPGLSPGHTLVFYMGFQHTGSIARALLSRGLDPATPALCAAQLTCPGQRLLTAPLDRVGAAVDAAGLQTPALLVVGDVVAFWQKLAEAARGDRP